jgi:RNA polymerase-interacting CarD/CdnL/TRCF family regulator
MATQNERTLMKADDLVVHPRHGVGRVLGVETREFSQGLPQLYYKIGIQTGTVWVPVDGPPTGLRKLTAKSDLDQYRQLLSGRPASLPRGYRERQIALLERLKQSSFEARCKVLRDLSALGWHKRLNQGNAGLLRTAHRDVCAEWAAAAGLSFNEAGAHVGSLLLEGRKTYDT